MTIALMIDNIGENFEWQNCLKQLQKISLSLQLSRRGTAGSPAVSLMNTNVLPPSRVILDTQHKVFQGEWTPPVSMKRLTRREDNTVSHVCHQSGIAALIFGVSLVYALEVHLNKSVRLTQWTVFKADPVIGGKYSKGCMDEHKQLVQ